MQDWRPIGSQFKWWCGQKENLSQVQSEQYHHQSLCTRVKYQKLSEVKIRSCHATVVEWRSTDPEVSNLNPGVAKKKISHRSNQNITTTDPPASRVKYLKLSEVNTRSGCGAVEECRTGNPEVPVQTLVWPKTKSLTGPIRTIPPPIPLHQSEIPEIVRGEHQKLLVAQW